MTDIDKLVAELHEADRQLNSLYVLHQITQPRRAADIIIAQRQRIETLEAALELADFIVQRLPSNGEHWDVLQRYAAALSKARGWTR